MSDALRYKVSEINGSDLHSLRKVQHFIDDGLFEDMTEYIHAAEVFKDLDDLIYALEKLSPHIRNVADAKALVRASHDVKGKTDKKKLSAMIKLANVFAYPAEQWSIAII